MVWSGYLVGRGPRVLLHHGLVVDVTVFELLVDSELILGGARVPETRGIALGSVFLRCEMDQAYSPFPLGANVRASADEHGPLILPVESAGLHQLVPGLEHVVPILHSRGSKLEDPGS